MAIGDLAKAAGMDVVLPSDDRRNGWMEINRTRDEIAKRQSQQVRNLSHPSNEMFLYWIAPLNRVVMRVDVTDIGYIATTADFGSRDAQIDQLARTVLELVDRVYALEQKANASA